MTRIYCGWCGSANGISARFCRMCGGELAAQSGPLSAPPVSRGSGRLPQLDGRTESAKEGRAGELWEAGERAVAAGEDSEDEADRELEVQEKEAVETLKRLRTSGPLIIEEAMKNKDQMNEIIGQAVEGTTPVADEPEVILPVEPRFPTGRVSQVIRLNQPAENRVGTRGSGRLAPPPAGGSGAPGGPPGANQGGPAQVLADASGLQTGSTIGMSLRIGLILLLLFVSTAGYLIFRERILGTAAIGTDVRELRSPQELSDEAVREGQQAESAGKIEVAITSYQRALQLTPAGPAPLLLLAQAYGKVGRIDESLATYADLLRVAPENLEARLQIAIIYQARNDWTTARREYRRIIALDQTSVQARLALEAIENYEAAQAGNTAVRQAAARKKVNRVVLPVLATPPIGQGGLSLDPPRLVTGVTESNQSRSAARLDLGPAAEPPAPATVAATRKDLGLRYLNIHEYRAAIKEFLIALRLTPEDKDIYYFLASAYHGLRQYAEAYDYYKRVDRGKYLQVSQSGARQTEKAAADQRRRLMTGNEPFTGGSAGRTVPNPLPGQPD